VQGERCLFVDTAVAQVEELGEDLRQVADEGGPAGVADVVVALERAGRALVGLQEQALVDGRRRPRPSPGRAAE